jgi:hypothetical protein
MRTMRGSSPVRGESSPPVTGAVPAGRDRRINLEDKKDDDKKGMHTECRDAMTWQYCVQGDLSEFRVPDRAFSPEGDHNNANRTEKMGAP